MLQPRRIEHERPTHPRICQVDRHTPAGADGGEPVGEGHVMADPQAAGDQGGAGVVAQARLGAVEGAADAGAEQVDRAGSGVADDRCPGQEEHAAGEPGRVQGWLG